MCKKWIEILEIGFTTPVCTFEKLTSPNQRELTVLLDRQRRVVVTKCADLKELLFKAQTARPYAAPLDVR